MITTYKVKELEYKAINDVYIELAKTEKKLRGEISHSHDIMLQDINDDSRQIIEERVSYAEAQMRVISDILSYMEQYYN